LPADFADYRRNSQFYLRLSALSAGENCPLISLIFAEESKSNCAHLRHLREKKYPADLADFPRRIQGYLRLSALSAGENCPLISLIFAEESKVICAYLRYLREKISLPISLIFAEIANSICAICGRK